jgi:hypothetical protein
MKLLTIIFALLAVWIVTDLSGTTPIEYCTQTQPVVAANGTITFSSGTVGFPSGALTLPSSLWKMYKTHPTEQTTCPQ